jgi:hypothetical protein
MKTERTVNQLLKEIEDVFLLIIETPVISDDFDRLCRKRNELMIELEHAHNPVQSLTQIKTYSIQRHEKSTYSNN